jgi:HPt (histidine-containing phosphotransfer) domain-containing protein
VILSEKKREELVNIGGEKFFLDLLDQFHQQSVTILSDLALAIEQGQAEKARGLLHKLKGSCLTMGAEDLASVVIELYQGVSTGKTLTLADVGTIRAALETFQQHKDSLRAR